MILIYTYEGGVKTIVFTDTLQTTFMLTGLVVCVIYILQAMDMSFGSALSAMADKGYSKIFFTDPHSKLFFFKTNSGRGVHHYHYDRYGPGNDAKDHFR